MPNTENKLPINLRKKKSILLDMSNKGGKSR